MVLDGSSRLGCDKQKLTRKQNLKRRKGMVSVGNVEDVDDHQSNIDDESNSLLSPLVARDDAPGKRQGEQRFPCKYHGR